MDPIMEMLDKEVKYESLVRSMSDDFSVVDLVAENATEDDDKINSDEFIDTKKHKDPYFDIDEPVVE